MIAGSRLSSGLTLAGSAAHTAGNVLAVVIAGRLFSILQGDLGEDEGRRLAGQIFGSILGDWIVMSWPIIGVLTLAGFIGALTNWRHGFRIGTISTLFLIVVVIGAHAWGHWLVYHVSDLRDSLTGEVDPALQDQFDHAHRTSTRVFAVETLAACLLAVGQIIGLARRGGPCDD